MKKIVTLILFAGMLASCHIVTPEEPEKEDSKNYEAVGLLTIPTSGFTKEDVRTKIVLVDDETLDIYMYEVKFAPLMPVTIDMRISGVPYSKTGSNIVFYGDSIVPTAGNKPYEKYIVRDLEGTVTADSMLISNLYGETPSVYAGAIVAAPK